MFFDLSFEGVADGFAGVADSPMATGAVDFYENADTRHVIDRVEFDHEKFGRFIAFDDLGKIVECVLGGGFVAGVERTALERENGKLEHFRLYRLVHSGGGADEVFDFFAHDVTTNGVKENL